jgi:hypothetical protein
MGHIVTATLIVAKTGDTERYFDKGAVLPDSVTAEERKRLVAIGVVKVERSAPAQTDAAAEKAAADAKVAADAKDAADAAAAAAAKSTPAKATPAK